MLHNLKKYAEENLELNDSNTSLNSESATSKSNPFPKFNIDEDDGYERANVGIKSLMSASKKLLAINRGEVEPDERDSIVFKRIYSVDDLLAERTRMDAGKIRNNIMFKLSKQKSLKNFPSGIFDSYMKGHIVGNQLSAPSEEINPIYLLDQQSRVTAFGQGGIGSTEAISPESQNVHPSQFSYMDVVASPDGVKAGQDLRFAMSTRITKSGKLITKVRNRKTGKIEWLTPEELSNYVVGFPQ